MNDTIIQLQIDQKEQTEQLAHKETICVHYNKMFNNKRYVKLYVKEPKKELTPKRLTKNEKKTRQMCLNTRFI